MGRPRKKILTGDFEPLGLGLVDHVAGGTKPYWIAQEDGKPNPSVEIEGSRIWWRQPRPLDAVIRRQKTIIYPNQPGYKWCSHCAEWVERLNFAENKSLRDGLQKWCRPCANRHARRMYWLSKEAKKLAA